MDRSAIVLAGGVSSRFGQDKGLLEIANKPLIKYVLDAVSPVVDETILVSNSQDRIAEYAKVVATDVRFAIDLCESKGPLIGALTGFEFAHGKYALLLPFDTPFVSRDVVSLLFELCLGKAAAIPRWPNGQIEPLHAVYQTKAALEAAKIAVSEGKLNVRAMIEKLRGVRYVSTLVIQQLDPELKTFFNINTPLDLKKAIAMVKPRKVK
ncbi:MAG TPA: molybdenum cofactor guanylyltransferase [Candidatus Bathyarchaeia archaeon]|nr:molybdenum cofactor guanylyltransferase [Candidatus Bathyarchaeia archaeon]